MPNRLLKLVVAVLFMAIPHMAAASKPTASNGGLPADPNNWVCRSSLIPATQQEMRRWCEDNRDRGAPLPQALRHPPPLSDLAAKNEYDLRFGAFLKSLRYKYELGWVSDPAWRFTGPIVGPTDGSGSSYATHLPVRVYYSPEVIDWLCEGRKGELPDGAAIVKEMHLISGLNIDIDDEGCMAINSALPDQDIIPQAWVPMIKNSSQSNDGWYWAGHQIELPKDVPGAIVDPPILDQTGIVRPDFFDNGLVPTAPDPRWYPSGYWPENKQKYPNVIMPLNTYGGFCLSCHASAEKEYTFASLDNILGKFIRYKQFETADGNGAAPDLFNHLPPGFADILTAFEKGTPPDDPEDTPVYNTPYTIPLAEPDPAVLTFYDQTAPVSFSETWPHRLPAQTYDHVVSASGGANAFLTSNQCVACHDSIFYLDAQSNMSLQEEVDSQPENINLSEWGEWSASPMGLAGRDPIFFAQLQGETNQLPELVEGIENTCLHCHAVMGQRQLATDTPGQQNPQNDLFFGVEPPPDVPKGRSFTRDMLAQWPNAPFHEEQKYGALGRDGISCAVCHRISTQELGRESTYTGNFVTDPPARMNGPYRQVTTAPMRNTLGVTPGFGKQIAGSEVCGTCHALLLPVITNDGIVSGYSYEQTTYLEWQNSDYGRGSTLRHQGQVTCQKCHMKTHYESDNLTFKIANIESSDFPPTTHRLPDQEIDLTERSPYSRHSLNGLNLFLNQTFQQFPILLGYRQGTFFNIGSLGKPPLSLNAESMVDMAQNETAIISIPQLSWTSRGKLLVRVEIQNLAGHNLPTGVGFRRMFIELLIRNGKGDIIWASGRTNKLGAILNGTSDNVLASEEPVNHPRTPFQPHYQVITRQDQVQIYEELVRDSDGELTTSFLRRVQEVKDNRIRPRGYNPQRFLHSPSPYIRALAKTPGQARYDADYQDPRRTGADRIDYLISLNANDLDQASTVEVTLYNQSIPPYYLQQRFRDAALRPDKSDDIGRLYYMTSHLNLAGEDSSGEPGALQNWKLRVGGVKQNISHKRWAFRDAKQGMSRFSR